MTLVLVASALNRKYVVISISFERIAIEGLDKTGA